MIVCKECGNAAESADGFCSSCGALLEWSGQRVETPAGTAPGQPGPVARQPVAERGRPGPVPLADQAVHTGLFCSACGVRNPEGRTFCRSCGEPLRAHTLVYGSKSGWWRRLMARLRGRRNYVAGERPRGFISHDTVPGAAGAGAGAAGMAGGGMAGAGAPGGAGVPGGAPGGVGGRGIPGAATAPHGFGGAAAQGFGASGQGAGGALRHSMHGAHAGQRMRRAKGTGARQLGRFAPLLVVLGLLGIGLGPAREWITVHVFHLAHQVENKVTQHYINVSPAGATASSSAHGHGADLAIDGVKQTYWLSGGHHSGVGAKLTVHFAIPEKIDKVGLLSGEPGAGYRAEARPQTIEVIVGGQKPVLLSFEDTSNFQDQAVSLSRVTAMDIMIKSVYPGQQGHAVAVTELEFFAKV